MGVCIIFPIVKVVQELKSDTLSNLRLCENIDSIKLFVNIYNILELTHEINLKYNNPIERYLIYDKDALSDMRMDLRQVMLLNDPSRYILKPYVNKMDKTIHYYRTLDQGS